MIYLITGQPGNGKSLLAIQMLWKEFERNSEAVKAGKEQPRRFFTNIAGATTEENPDAWPWVEKLPDHNDWTKLPDGSYVIYDECHADGNTQGLERYGRLFPSTGKPGESDDSRIRAMSTHRHRGFDLVLITQWPSKVHHQVRSLVGEHIHLNRAMGLAASGLFRWSRVQVNPYDEKEREKAEEEIWNHPKDLYKRYKSSSLHTASHKFKIPAKVWAGLSKLLVTLLVLWGLWAFLVPDSAKGKSEKPEGQGAVQASGSLLPPAPPAHDSTVVLMDGMGAYLSINTEPAPTLAGCVSSDRGCRCFNSDGYLIDMAQHACLDIISKPLPFNVLHEFRTGTSTAPASPKSFQDAGAGVVIGGPSGAFPETPPSALQGR